MLVDIDLNHPNLDPWKKILREHNDGDDQIAVRLHRGIYYAYSLDHDVEYAVKDDDPFDFPRCDYERMEDDAYRQHWWNLSNRWVSGPKSYGICDNMEQVVLKWPQLEWCDEKYLIYGHEVHKKHQAEQGFRFHKHGWYIGTHEDVEHYEYLKDHPTLEYVWVYHILEIKDEFAVL